MIDINFTARDLYGNTTFGWRTTSNTGIETILQKIVVMAFSDIVTTYFNQINGLGLDSAGSYTFDSSGSNDFKMYVTSNLVSLQTQLIAEDTLNSVPYADRLKSLTLKNLVYDTQNQQVAVTLVVSTNSSSTILTLPVKA